MKERLQELLPWLLTDRLGEDERRELEAALAGDAEAEELLAYAGILRRAVREEGEEEQLSSRLLVDYVERPDQLPEDVRWRIEEGLEGDPRAAEAVSILRQMASVPEPEGAVVRRSDRRGAPSDGLRALWEGLLGLAQHPVPAYAHLLVLVVAVLLVWAALQRGASPGSTSGGVVQLASVEAETRLRGADGGAEPTTLVVPYRTDAPVVLELVTGLDLEDLAALQVDLEIVGPQGFTLRRRLGGRDFEEGSVLRLLLPGDPAPPAGRYELELRYHAPDAPLDGQVAFVAIVELRS